LRCRGPGALTPPGAHSGRRHRSYGYREAVSIKQWTGG
jgi:hypothetical protein